MPYYLSLIVVIAALCAFTGEAFAHREDYIDETLVYQTLEREEFEPEYWFDFGRRFDTGNNFTRHNFAAEYGFTDHWMVDGRVTAEKEDGRSFSFDSGRLETRYRFYEEGTLPVDIALSVEVNTERDEANVLRFGIEPRLILSKDFGKLNLTLNLAEEIPVDSRREAFNISSGFRYDATELFRFGSELKYNVDERQASVIPQIWFAFPHDLTLKLGFSYGFDHNKESFLRVAIEKGF